MAMQLSVSARNARLEAIETVVGPSPTLKLWTGDQPASCAAADRGSLIATFPLTADWAGAASNGTKAFALSASDVISTALALISGTPAHYRLYASDGTCHMQGSVGAPGSGANLTINNVTVTQGQTINIVNWSITDGNA